MNKKYIRNNATKEIRLSKWQDGSRYWWEEGNASCDCNRALAFGDSWYQHCGDERYDLVNEDGTPYNSWDIEDAK